MRDCPKCGDPVDGQICPSCKYSEAQDAQPGPYRDPFFGCCEYLDRGLRCANSGTISPSTHGTTDAKGKTRSGPWYCREHIGAVRGGGSYSASKTPPPQGFQGIKQILRKDFPAQDREAIEERAALQAHY